MWIDYWLSSLDNTEYWRKTMDFCRTRGRSINWSLCFIAKHVHWFIRLWTGCGDNQLMFAQHSSTTIWTGWWDSQTVPWRDLNLYLGQKWKGRVKEEIGFDANPLTALFQCPKLTNVPEACRKVKFDMCFLLLLLLKVTLL